jgi:hypothetical protein
MISLPNHIIKALKNNVTSLGEHPAFPPEEEEKFIVPLYQYTFENLLENIPEDYTEETLKTELARLITQCKKSERGQENQLEKLCCDIVTELFDIPEDSLILKAELVNKVESSNERLVPDETSEDFSFDDIDDMKYLTDEVYKRRMLNALIAGASTFYTEYITNHFQEIFTINNDLPALYKKIIDYNNILLFTEKVTFEENETTEAGKVDVIIGTGDETPKIESSAVIFPALVSETIKGVLELVISHGLPKDIEKAKYVMSKADFKLCESWDVRLGYTLWNLLSKRVEQSGYSMEEIGICYLLLSISELDCDEFNEFLQEVFAGTKKGKRMLSEMVDEILLDGEREAFESFAEIMNMMTSGLSEEEEYYSPEELLTDDYKW